LHRGKVWVLHRGKVCNSREGKFAIQERESLQFKRGKVCNSREGKFAIQERESLGLIGEGKFGYCRGKVLR